MRARIRSEDEDEDEDDKNKRKKKQDDWETAQLKNNALSSFIGDLSARALTSHNAELTADSHSRRHNQQIGLARRT